MMQQYSEISIMFLATMTDTDALAPNTCPGIKNGMLLDHGCIQQHISIYCMKDN